ncbi:MAG: hypothetical protein AABX23_03010 [Nanoarchaeota archaeon]
MKKSKLAPMLGFGLATVGLLGGTLTRYRAPEKDNLIIERYFQAHEDVVRAQNRFESVRHAEGFDIYTPQSDRRDYSVPQAHSRTEKAYQDIEVAKSEVKRLEEQPEIKIYSKENKLSDRLYLIAIAGFFIGLIGLNRSKDRSVSI